MSAERTTASRSDRTSQCPSGDHKKPKPTSHQKIRMQGIKNSQVRVDSNQINIIIDSQSLGQEALNLNLLLLREDLENPDTRLQIEVSLGRIFAYLTLIANGLGVSLNRVSSRSVEFLVQEMEKQEDTQVSDE